MRSHCSHVAYNLPTVHESLVRSFALIRYALEPDLSAAEFIECLERSSLAERRPVSQLDTIEGMLCNADLIVTAREPMGMLVGVARSITDFSYCTYLSDLAVDAAYQKQGIGKKLIEITHEHAGLKTMLILLSAPKAATYYPHIGMTQHKSAWTIPRSS